MGLFFSSLTFSPSGQECVGQVRTQFPPLASGHRAVRGASVHWHVHSSFICACPLDKVQTVPYSAPLCEKCPQHPGAETDMSIMSLYSKALESCPLMSPLDVSWLSLTVRRLILRHWTSHRPLWPSFWTGDILMSPKLDWFNTFLQLWQLRLLHGEALDFQTPDMLVTSYIYVVASDCPVNTIRSSQLA